MRVELTRRVESPRDEVFGLVTDTARWPVFYNNVVSVDEDAGFDLPGDRMGFEYRILGRIVSAEARIVAAQRPELLELEVDVPDAVTSRHHWHFEPDDADTLVSVRLEVDEVTEWFGQAVDRFVIARSLQADLRRTLDNLADLVTSGLV